MRRAYKRLAAAIVEQAAIDFLAQPHLRLEIESDINSVLLNPGDPGFNLVKKKTWEMALEEANIHYDKFVRALDMAAVNARHRVFLGAVKKVLDEQEATEAPITMAGLASVLGWTAEQTEAHCKEYKYMYLFEKKEKGERKDGLKRGAK